MATHPRRPLCLGVERGTPGARLPGRRRQQEAGMQHRRRSTLAAALLLIASLGAAACSDAASTSRSGAGMNYRGSFYNLSTLEVAPVALGGVLDRQVPFQDGHIDVRRGGGGVARRPGAGHTPPLPRTRPPP